MFIGIYLLVISSLHIKNLFSFFFTFPVFQTASERRRTPIHLTTQLQHVGNGNKQCLLAVDQISKVDVATNIVCHQSKH